jgi:hypothetical protein
VFSAPHTVVVTELDGIRSEYRLAADGITGRFGTAPLDRWYRFGSVPSVRDDGTIGARSVLEGVGRCSIGSVRLDGWIGSEWLEPLRVRMDRLHGLGLDPIVHAGIGLESVLNRSGFGLESVLNRSGIGPESVWNLS